MQNPVPTKLTVVYSWRTFSFVFKIIGGFVASTASPPRGDFRLETAPEPRVPPTAPSRTRASFWASKEKLRLSLYVALASIDVAALSSGFALANLMRYGTIFDVPGKNVTGLLLPLFLLLAAHNRAYSIECLSKPSKGIRRSLQSLVIACAILIGTIFYLKVSAEYSRAVIALGSFLAVVLVGVFRWVFGQIVGHRNGWNFINEVLLVDGVLVSPKQHQIVAFADHEGISPFSGDPIALDRIGQLLNNSDRVILACPPERRAAWASILKGLHLDVELLTPELRELGPLAMRRQNDDYTLLVSCGPLALRDRLLKRAFDLSIALPVLALLAPLMTIVAIALRLESRGPVFFKQERVGRGNRIFKVLKFRSMRQDARDVGGHRSASRNDDRVTRVGRLLRRSSLDELPQLINVIKGEMSLVGPRPHALASTAGDSLFWQLDDRYIHRHAIKPGITGLAQVRGHRGATASPTDLLNRLQADLEYLSGWSIWRDLRIVLRTFKVIVHSNAF